MADKKDAGPPPLEDPNSPDYVCVTCQNNVNALCLACQEMAQLRANSTRNERDNSDRDTPQPMSDSDSTDSAYDVDTISDSPNSCSSTLLLNVSDNSNDENAVSDNNVNEEELEILEEPAAAAPAALMPHTVVNFDESGFYFRAPSTSTTTLRSRTTKNSESEM